MNERALFECQRCGSCCRIPGEVRLLKGEPEAIAAELGMSTDAFIQAHTRLTRDRLGLSIVERADHSCAMLESDGCRIQKTKPYQCRAFPHEWNYDGWERICLAADAGSRRSQIGGRKPLKMDSIK